MITIRREKSIDAAAIRRVLDSAFERPDEANAIDALRKRGALVLSMVALRAETVVSHVAFTKATLEEGVAPAWREVPGQAPPPATRIELPLPSPPMIDPVERIDVQWLSLEEEAENEAMRAEMEAVAKLAAEARAVRAAEQRRAIATRVLSPSGGASSAPPLVALGPLSTFPNLQRKGIASALVEAAIEQLRRMQAEAVCVLGDPAYYERFGFVPSHAFGIDCELAIPNRDAFRILELKEGSLGGRHGVMRFEPELRALD